MIIRPAAANDLATIAEIAETTWLETFSVGLGPSDIQEALACRDLAYFEKVFAEHQILVASRAAAPGVIDGFVECIVSSHEMVIDKLYVTRERQGDGIGRRLMEQVLRQADLSELPARLDVWVENPRAIGLYQSLGFEIYGERRFVNAAGEEMSPDLLMQRLPYRPMA